MNILQKIKVHMKDFLFLILPSNLIHSYTV